MDERLWKYARLVDGFRLSTETVGCGVEVGCRFAVGIGCAAGLVASTEAVGDCRAVAVETVGAPSSSSLTPQAVESASRPAMMTMAPIAFDRCRDDHRTSLLHSSLETLYVKPRP